MSACCPAFLVRTFPVALLVVLLCAVSPVSAQKERPFLIVREDMYEELRGRAAREPWVGIAKGAVEGAAGSLGYSPGWSFLYTCQRLTEVYKRCRAGLHPGGGRDEKAGLRRLHSRCHNRLLSQDR